MGMRWFNVTVDPWKSKNQKHLFAFAGAILQNHSQAFVHVIGAKDGGISHEILSHAARLVKHTSGLSSNGQDNFRLGVSANVKADGPFFPFTMSSGKLGFSIALELTQTINDYIQSSEHSGLDMLRAHLCTHIRQQIDTIQLTAEQISESTGIVFQGFDFSLAPITESNGSVMSMLRALGIHDFNGAGLLFATAFITDFLKSLGAGRKTVGFSGVMYSLLEDMELCAINNQHGISIERLISLSSVCGCGLDMVPVCGDMSEQEYIAIFVDVAALAIRLGKPLGVRILPIPRTQNEVDGQFTCFNNDADFVTNTKVVRLRASQQDMNISDSFFFLEGRQNGHVICRSKS